MRLELVDLQRQLLDGDPRFWDGLASRTLSAESFGDLMSLSALRKKAEARRLARRSRNCPRLRLAILGGCSLYPLHDLLLHTLDMEGMPCDLFLGEYDNYHAEAMEPDGGLYTFRPEFVLVIPSASRCRYSGALTDGRSLQEAAALRAVEGLLDLCRKIHLLSRAEVILANFLLPERHDLGAYRTRTLGSDWSFRKYVNLELGLRAPSFVRILDMEFLAYRHGALAVRDDRAWFESKQPWAPPLLPVLVKELTHLIASFRRPPKKLLVLDLDNTLWGGVVADDGVEGIEIGDTSPRGEAFKAFQRYIATLKARGVLLAVCSKNDRERAAEPFERHPEMVLRLSDFVAFQANWEPKSENIRRISADLDLGLDSLVFVDDDPAEIEIVRRFAPEVSTLLLGADPATYAGDLADSRFFEPTALTAEDSERTGHYRSEAARKAVREQATDMHAYLTSLEMEGVFTELNPLDVPRAAQLIGRSNQFNLTTHRRTEAEVLALLGRPEIVAFSMRLKDRFGDHGLISVVIGEQEGETLEIDTWLMSCRVLKRQVEEEVLNELVRMSRLRGCSRLEGVYLQTPKNGMVSDFYPRMGFRAVRVTPVRGDYRLDLAGFEPAETKIRIVRHSHDAS